MSPESARRLQRGARALAVVGVFSAVLAARVLVASRAELHEGHALRAAGEIDAAIGAYRRAAAWYAPGSPYVVEALDALEAIGRAAEAEENARRALSAYRAIHAALMSSRSLYVPHRARLARADARIAALVAAEDPPPLEAERGPEERRRDHLSRLSRHPGPSLGFALAALVGFATWVTAAFAFSHRAIDPDDRLVPREAARWGVLFAAGFGLFCLGLALA